MAYLRTMYPACVALAALSVCPVALSAVPGTTNSYTISGNSTNAGWSIEFSVGTSPPGSLLFSGSVDCPGIPKGQNCAQLTAQFIDCINMAFSGANRPFTAQVDPHDPCSFSVTGPNAFTGELKMFVGTSAQEPDCEVDSAGCSVNPDVFLTGTTFEPPIPAASEFGYVALALILAIAALRALRRLRVA